MSRAVAYIDLGRALRGNETLQIFSSPLLKEVVRKAIGRGGKHSHSSTKTAFSAPLSTASSGKSFSYPNVQFVSGVRSDEPSFAFLGNLGIPFIHLSVSNSPKVNWCIIHVLFHFPSLRLKEKRRKLLCIIIIIIFYLLSILSCRCAFLCCYNYHNAQLRW